MASKVIEAAVVYKVELNQSYADDSVESDDSDCDNPRLTICLDDEEGTTMASPGLSDQEVPATPTPNTEHQQNEDSRKDKASENDFCDNFQSQNKYVQQEMDRILKYVSHAPEGVQSSHADMDSMKTYSHSPEDDIPGINDGMRFSPVDLYDCTAHPVEPLPVQPIIVEGW